MLKFLIFHLATAQLISVPIEKRLPHDSGRLLNSYDRSVQITNERNMQYHSYFYVGSHRQKMSFILDTGSAWMWLPSAKCPVDECRGERFNASMSETFKDMN